MGAFGSSLLGVFLMELGDKTQLVALSLATRFNAWVTLAGILVATLVIHIFSVAIGWCAAEAMPLQWIAYVAGLSFIAFGFWTLRGDCIEGDEECKCKTRSPFMLVAVTFFLAELGDKTMIGTCTLASQHPSQLIPVWLGSSLGMVISDGLAIIVGVIFGKTLPERAVKIGASAIFFGFGIYKTVEGALQLAPYMWGIAAVTVAAMAYIFLLRPVNRVICAEIIEEKQDETLAHK